MPPESDALFRATVEALLLGESITDACLSTGILCSVVPNNNQSGHGFYQFSSEIFLAAFSSPYGMKVSDSWVASSMYDPSTWISVTSVKYHKFARNHDFENMMRFFLSQ